MFRLLEVTQNVVLDRQEAFLGNTCAFHEVLKNPKACFEEFDPLRTLCWELLILINLFVTHEKTFRNVLSTVSLVVDLALEPELIDFFTW